MIRLPPHVILTCLFVGLGVSEYEYGGNTIPDDVPPLEGVYMMSAPGENCLNTCFDAGINNLDWEMFTFSFNRVGIRLEFGLFDQASRINALTF